MGFSLPLLAKTFSLNNYCYSSFTDYTKLLQMKLDESIKIIITDNSPEFIEGLLLLLSFNPKYKVIEVCNNGNILLQSQYLYQTNILLMDIEMPGINGIETAKRVNYKFPHIPMIAISMFQDKVYLDKIIEAGFKGIIYKPEMTENIYEGIDKVLKGELYFPRDINIMF